MRRSLLLFGLIALLLAGILSAQLISVKDLSAMMEDENLVIVSARKASDYNTVHIKGAMHLWFEDLEKTGAVKGLLKSPDDVAKILGEKGIAESNKIVLYCDTGVRAGRIYWVLDYLGADDVHILDGQMKAWRKARKPVTKDATVLEATTFTPSVNADVFATMDYVKNNKDKPGVVLVDVRSPEEFNGEKGEASRKGHIPGAINFEHKQIITEDETLISQAEMKTLFTNAGITADKEIILYCETSLRTGIIYFALKSLLGYGNVKVYDGGIYEWAATASNPME